MAVSALKSAVLSRSILQMKNVLVKSDILKNAANSSRCLAFMPVVNSRLYSNMPTGGQLKSRTAKRKITATSSSETDSDLEPSGHRGESTFWRQKIRTFHGIVDVNKDGVISYDDFKLLAERFIELGHLSEKHTVEFRKMLRDLWEKRWGPVNPYNLITVEQFLEDMHHIVNDKKMVRKAHSFLPYLFRAVDKDGSGVISIEEFKLFYTCLGLNEKDAALAFKCLDDDHDGVVSRKEFVKHGREFFLNEDEKNVSKHFFGPLIEH